jgi:hypothetical protein
MCGHGQARAGNEKKHTFEKLKMATLALSCFPLPIAQLFFIKTLEPPCWTKVNWLALSLTFFFSTADRSLSLSAPLTRYRNTNCRTKIPSTTSLVASSKLVQTDLPPFVNFLAMLFPKEGIWGVWVYGGGVWVYGGCERLI